ncbi:MAG: hypothetical protein HXX13_16700 [Bacteroidetes bacterium]|nr:hypothetical protein [Bacteroidota bacterium]
MNKSLHLLNSILHPYHTGKVKFILSGSVGDYNITYKGNEDHAYQVPHARKSWRHSFTAKEGEYVYFSAQANEPGAQVQIKIVYNGKVFKTSTAMGDFAIALAGGCLC